MPNYLKKRRILPFKALKMLGWKVGLDFPDLKKTITIFAPHTTYWDGLYGKLYLMQYRINYKFLSKKELFKFPLNIFFKLYGSIPVSKNKEYIDEIATVFRENESLHIVMSPEGHLNRNDHWKKGFYYMAKRANVPIVVAYMDYKKKEVGVKGVITDLENMKETFQKVSEMYRNMGAKYPEKFALDKRYS